MLDHVICRHGQSVIAAEYGTFEMRTLQEVSLLVLALQLVSLAVCLLGSSVSDHPLALTGDSQRSRMSLHCILYHRDYVTCTLISMIVQRHMFIVRVHIPKPAFFSCIYYICLWSSLGFFKICVWLHGCNAACWPIFCYCDVYYTCRLYVVSVDGVLSALDWEGRQMWSYQLAEPLFSSTLNYKVCSCTVCCTDRS